MYHYLFHTCLLLTCLCLHLEVAATIHSLASRKRCFTYSILNTWECMNVETHCIIHGGHGFVQAVSFSTSVILCCCKLHDYCFRIFFTLVLPTSST